MMLPSVEARWFMQGSAPLEALEWIQRWEIGPCKAEKREDHYLIFPTTTSIGIKLRDGKFEVKRRDTDFGLIPLGFRAIGRLALWRKWSFKVVDDCGNKTPDSHWITVGKERYLRKYSIRGDNLTAVDPTSFPARGCTVELTRINALGREWWSIGFEAFGPDEGELPDTLTLAAAKCFITEDYPNLSGEDSFDYPEWLSLLK